MPSRVSLPQKIIIEYNFYKCDESCFDGTRLRMHLNRVHNVLSSPSISGKRRRSNKKIQYVKYGDDPVAIVHNVCPSCLEHFFDMNGLVNHLNQQHLLKEHIEGCAYYSKKNLTVTAFFLP
jgi:hypothetical protein